MGVTTPLKTVLRSFDTLFSPFPIAPLCKDSGVMARHALPLQLHIDPFPQPANLSSRGPSDP
jgi:hypothetical protein